jgi:hypothetical protein
VGHQDTFLLHVVRFIVSAAKVSKFFKMTNKLCKKNGQFGELLPFALAVPNNQMAQSNLPQPEIRKASACAPDAFGRHIPMLCQPKMSRGACHCATGALAAGVAMLRDYRVGDRDFAN